MSAAISSSLLLRTSVTNQIAFAFRFGRASSGPARKPLGPRVVSMQTPRRSTISQIRSASLSLLIIAQTDADTPSSTHHTFSGGPAFGLVGGNQRRHSQLP